MRPAERVTIIREIVAAMTPGEWDDIDLVLKEFGFPWRDTWNDSPESYVRAMIEEGADEQLQELHAFLYSGASKADPHPEIWRAQFIPGDAVISGDFFRLFLSHTHEHKVEVAALKIALIPHGISAFVAHEDIDPTEEWEEVITAGLETCDALLAYLTPDFVGSKWTDQEVGVCIGKGKPIIPVRVGADPHGFLGKYQGAQGVGRDAASLAGEVARILRVNKRTERRYAEVLVDRLCEAYSYDNARTMFRQVQEIPTRLWTHEMMASARESAATNGELIDGFIGDSTVAAETIALVDTLEAGARA
jgi:hypothetical protein